MITPLEKRRVFSILFGFLILTPNLFSQETNLYSEQKLNERLKKHQESLKKDQEHLIPVSEQNTPDTLVNSNSLVESNTPFPVFIDTGNPEQDQADYKLKKDKWILENPEQYKALNVGTPMSQEQMEELELKKKQRLNNY